EKVARVHGPVAEELEQRSVQLVRTGLGDDIHYRARGAAILRAVIVGLDAELLESVGIRERVVHVGPGILVARAIREVCDALAAGTGETPKLPPTRCTVRRERGGKQIRHRTRSTSRD